MADENVIRRLLAGFMQGQQEAAPTPSDVDEERPWDSPVLQHPSMQVPRDMMQRVMPRGTMQGIAPTRPGPMQPADDALVQALLKRAINQEFARIGGQPIPR